MDIPAAFERLYLTGLWRLLRFITTVVTVFVLFQIFVLPHGKIWSLSPANRSLVTTFVKNTTISNTLESIEMSENDPYSSNKEAEFLDEIEIEYKDKNSYLVSNKSENNEFALKVAAEHGKSSMMGYATSTNDTSIQAKGMESKYSHPKKVVQVVNIESVSGLMIGGAERRTNIWSAESRISSNSKENMGGDSRARDIFSVNLTSSVSDFSVKKESANNKLLHRASLAISSPKRSVIRQPTSINQMNSLLLQGLVSSHSMRPWRSSVRDLEILSARAMIEKAPVMRNIPGLYASAFRNFSVFKRSYELMERILKVYIYKEGKKPIFHQPKMRGIYASEGWFMKLMEGSKKFVVKDPKKAHLFYLPFSSNELRRALFGQEFQSPKDLEQYLNNYVGLIAKKYSSWNRTRGADHFLVGCHDWAPKFTRQRMANCIRSLCNANVARGFKIGKDATLPVTYIRSAEIPLEYVGGKPLAERHILAFFAGGMHGYLRPILLWHWGNKEPDMKIFGPMPRDVEGKRTYREYMKSSRYCICARGYEVHTPRVVEALLYECIPVIISDNYVPPFFEVLNWEAFAVFVQEKDIPNLRSILLSIPEEKYRAMHLRIKMVQKHFLFHKNPLKYDLFHMILHSIWYNRVFQVGSR
ncbi:hypothetical protein K2173_015920 [Erythroxylum novogranatense]|uniref:Exostosin GT47 domain-containing protein n=1 Tax=Erythroxylum novogranatense TaxID=1862640 RepID=A0AAV8SFE5_9ROSI|nr:hypothetical protein K2173_015920 [Erythroxylum novogranatense]